MSYPHLLKPVPMFADNYLWLRISPAGDVLAVDPGDYALLSRVLQEHDWRLATVLVTHHHADHCAGEMQQKLLAELCVPCCLGCVCRCLSAG